MTALQNTQRHIRRLEAEIDRLNRQTVLDKQFLGARNDRLAYLKHTLDAKRRTLARLVAQDA